VHDKCCLTGIGAVEFNVPTQHTGMQHKYNGHRYRRISMNSVGVCRKPKMVKIQFLKLNRPKMYEYSVNWNHNKHCQYPDKVVQSMLYNAVYHITRGEMDFECCLNPTIFPRPNPSDVPTM